MRDVEDPIQGFAISRETRADLFCVYFEYPNIILMSHNFNVSPLYRTGQGIIWNYSCVWHVEVLRGNDDDSRREIDTIVEV